MLTRAAGAAFVVVPLGLAGPWGAAAAPIPAAADPAVPDAGSTRVVYLTFDDGPSSYTDDVLAVLEKYAAKATFFQIGFMSRARPTVSRQIIASGHAIGNHTWDHPRLTKLGRAGITWELSRAQQVLPDGSGRCMRPPYGEVNSRVRSVVRAQGYRMYLWTLDTRDWTRPGSAVIVNRVTSRVRPGSIVLMHDGGGNRSGTVAALRRLLPWLVQQGYTMAALPGCHA